MSTLNYQKDFMPQQYKDPEKNAELFRNILKPWGQQGTIESNFLSSSVHAMYITLLKLCDYTPVIQMQNDSNSVS